MTKIDEAKSFEAFRARSSILDIGGHKLRVADLEAIVESQRAAGHPQDEAVLDILEKALDEERKRVTWRCVM